MLLGSGRELASRFQELGSHLLKVLHFLSPLHFALQNTTDLGKRCLFGIGLNAQVSSAGDTRQEAEAVKMTKRAPPSMGGGETAGPLGLAESGAGEPRIVYGPTGLGVTPTQERDRVRSFGPALSLEASFSASSRGGGISPVDHTKSPAAAHLTVLQCFAHVVALLDWHQQRIILCVRRKESAHASPHRSEPR